MNGRTNSSDVTIQEINYGALIPLEPITKLDVIVGDQRVHLVWADPENKYVSGTGELVSEWDYTLVVRKNDSAPQTPSDGVVITTSTIHNQYSTSAFIDETVENNVLYYYSVFAFTTMGVSSIPVSISALPKSGEPRYLQTIESGLYSRTGNPVTDITASTVGDYIIFAGGYELVYDDYESLGLAVAYNTELVRVSTSNLRTAVAGACRGEVPGYALFSGGAKYGGSNAYYGSANDTLQAYSENLTITSIDTDIIMARNSSSTTLGEHVVYAGGKYDNSRGDSYTSNVRSFDSSLTFVNASSGLDDWSNAVGATSIGEYAIFVCGSGKYGSQSTGKFANCYTEDLTSVEIDTVSNLMTNNASCHGCTIEQYAIFAKVSGVEGYSYDLTHIDSAIIPQPDDHAQIAEDNIWVSYINSNYNFGNLTFGKYAVIPYYYTGGSSGMESLSAFMMYDRDLTLTTKALSSYIPNYEGYGLYTMTGAILNETLGLFANGNENEIYVYTL